GENLEKKGLELLVRAVDLVDEEHDGPGCRDRLEQRARQEEIPREESVGLVPENRDRRLEVRCCREDLTGLVAQELSGEQLLAVRPLVQRLRLVEAFVALEADQRGRVESRPELGDLRLADAGRPFEQKRLAEALREEQRRRDVGTAHEPRRRELLDDRVRGDL